MQIKLEENEKIEDLELNNLKIIQNRKGFCFGIDSVLLSDFAKDIKRGAKVIDLGTGTGILPIILSAKTEASKFIAVELQQDLANMVQKSILLNKLENKIEIICQDIKNLKEIYNKNSFDVVITNPPYKKIGTGAVNENQNKLISRHEVKANLEDFIKIASYLLKNQGIFFMVQHSDRLIDTICNLRKYNLEPKEIKFVQANINKKPNIFLVKAVKNAKPFLKMTKPIYIYKENNEYTDEVLKIYGKGEF